MTAVEKIILFFIIILYPIDTWVVKITKKLGCDTNNIEKIKEYFIEKCINSGINPLKFAAGIWFLGIHSLDILLENYLGTMEIRKN